LDLDLKQFRRKGENEGEVILTLEGADERFYQIIRKVKAAASLEIKDFETQRKISATKVDAEKWLSRWLGRISGGFGKTFLRMF
jgi:DNA repair exonuclease SbcCD ATPase subunit